jgi:hypothetical protein
MCSSQKERMAIYSPKRQEEIRMGKMKKTKTEDARFGKRGN